MGFLCNKRNEDVHVDQIKLTEQNFLRDIGLDNVNTINTEVSFCTEIFKNPEFYVSGATKLYSGLTVTLTGCTTGSTAIYNLDYTSDFNINYVITGNTDYQNYLGYFNLKVFSKDKFNTTKATNLFVNGSEIVKDSFKFSDITASTVTESFSVGNLPKTWGEYLIRPYFTFLSKDCNPGTYIDTWTTTPQLNLFNNDSDYYFMTVINPPTPNLLPPPLAPIPNYSFIQDILLANGLTGPRSQEAINDSLNYFILRAKPSDPTQVLVFVNGVKMTYNYDYVILTTGFSTPSVVKFNGDNIKITDVVVANYIVGAPLSASNIDFNQWFVNSLYMNTITVDTNPGTFPTVMTVNKNTITNNYEIYVTQPIDPNNAIFLTINGVEMVQDRQFYLSTSQQNRIILDKTYANPINVGDVISILAVSPNLIFGNNDYGSLTKNEFSIQWTINNVIPEGVTGRFLVQVVDKNDTNYNTILYQKILLLENDKSNYETTITNLALNQYYMFRVLYETTYTGYLNNKVTTCSFSDGYFDTKNSYINNTY